ncbi:MAG: transglutaminase family protein, partial [Fimbriimonadaceae bacterium]|nr:transglutaminase family protein [Fimbriimonadaceae bacterium]
MLLGIEHQITFKYDDFISESWMELRMEPKHSMDQSVGSFFLAIGPPAKVFRYQDWMGNTVHHFSVADFHEEVKVLAKSVVETHPRVVPLEELRCHPVPRSEAGPLLEWLRFGGPIVRSAALTELASKVKAPDGSIGHLVAEISDIVRGALTYMPGVTTYSSTTEDALRLGRGVCQDFAQVMIGLLRLLGVPARYVSGYLHVVREGHEISESHAWLEV